MNQDHAAAALAAQGIPVFAWRGETHEEFESCMEQAMEFPPEGMMNMILDDGGRFTEICRTRRPLIWKNIRGWLVRIIKQTQSI